MCARKGSNGAQENGQRLAGEQRKCGDLGVGPAFLIFDLNLI